jgi:hypothetical protein
VFLRRSVVFFDHLDAGAAVLRDLVDVCTFEDICMPQAVRCALITVAIDLLVFFFQDRIE